jgi:D-3-phosphoglycerate dehydrogenase / 2-oxoglutarate reductase
MTNRKRVLVSSNLTDAAWKLLKSRPDIEAVSYAPPPSAEAFRDLLAGIHGVALSMQAFAAAELARADALQVIGRFGVGYDSVDVPACTARGVVLMTTGTANSTAVAEHAVASMLALARRGADFTAMVREGRWNERLVAPPIDLWEKTVLVVGCGRIGSRVVRRCRAFEMRVLVADPYIDPARIREAGGEPVTLAEALPQADFVTLHCPRNAETIGLIGAEALARMRPGAFVVNTARGGIVDEAALHAALAAGHVAAAALDVFDREPVATDNPLFTLANVQLSPHVAGCSVQALDRMSHTTIANILSVLDGAPIVENVVNPEALKK